MTTRKDILVVFVGNLCVHFQHVAFPAIFYENIATVHRESCSDVFGVHARNAALLASTPIPKGTVEKQQSVFFLLRVTEQIARSGLVLRCTSTNKSRFKLVVSLSRYAGDLCSCHVMKTVRGF